MKDKALEDLLITIRRETEASAGLLSHFKDGLDFEFTKKEKEHLKGLIERTVLRLNTSAAHLSHIIAYDE